MAQTTPPPSKQEKAGVRPADLDIEESLSTMQYGIEEMRRGDLKTKVEKESLKEKITEEFTQLFKNPEAVKGLIGIAGFLTIMELFGPKEELESKEEGIEEAQDELDVATSAGLVEGEIEAAEGEAIEFKIENSDKFHTAYLKALKKGYPDLDVVNLGIEKGDFKDIFKEILDNKQSFDPYDIKAWEGQFIDLFDKGFISKEKLKEIYPYADNIDVTRNYQTIAIQLKAAMNKRNTRQLKELGITIPKGVKKLTAISIFRKGIGSYEHFKEKLAKTLQPDVKDPNKLTDNLAAILSRCALGKYQILPKHYFKPMGWPHKGEEGLKAIYEFLRSPDKQQKTAKKSVVSRLKKYGGDAYAMAAAHYGGPRSGQAMLKYRKALKESGAAEKPEWLDRKQTMGGGTFGSISYYANTVVKYYGKEKVSLKSNEDIDKFLEAIGKKETGFLAGKRAKSSTVSIDARPAEKAKRLEPATKESSEFIKGITTFKKAMEVFEKGTREQKDVLAQKFGYPTLAEVESSYGKMAEGAWKGEQTDTMTTFEATDSAALTLDICTCYGHKKTETVVSVIDEAMKKNIPITFFVTGSALTNPEIRDKVLEASKKPHIQIANHGFSHRPFATKEIDASDGSKISGKGKKWKQKITSSISELYDETIGGAITIAALTGKRPKYIRAATLWSTKKGSHIAAKITGAIMVGRTERNGKGMDDGGGSGNPKRKFRKMEAGDIFLGHAKNDKVLSTLREMESDNNGSYITNAKGQKVYISSLG